VSNQLDKRLNVNRNAVQESIQRGHEPKRPDRVRDSPIRRFTDKMKNIPPEIANPEHFEMPDSATLQHSHAQGSLSSGLYEKTIAAAKPVDSFRRGTNSLWV
jgi:hypothetical protein